MSVLSHRSAERGTLEPEVAFVIATATLLDEGVPYTELSVEQIARKAGRSRSTFYVHFRDKRELLLYATQEIAESLYAAATDWLREPVGEESTRTALQNILSIYRQHPGLLGAIIEASGYDERVRQHWRELMDRFVTAAARRLLGDELVVQGAAARKQAQAFALVWMTERACYQQLTGGGVEGDEALVEALTKIWDLTASPMSDAPYDVPRQHSDWAGQTAPPGDRANVRAAPAPALVNPTAARRARRQPFRFKTERAEPIVSTARALEPRQLADE